MSSIVVMSGNSNTYPQGYPAATIEKLNAASSVKWWRFTGSAHATYDVLRYRRGNEKDGFYTAWRLVRNTSNITRIYPKTLAAITAIGSLFTWMYFEDKRIDRLREENYKLESKMHAEFDRGYKMGVAHVAGEGASPYEASEYRPLITYLRNQRRQAANEQAARRMRDDLTRSFPEIINKI